MLVQQRHYHLPKVPTKYELLQQARGFIQRLKVHIKFPLMRQMRPFTLNDMTALFSWIFLGHTVWFLVGTTSFISFGLWAANSLQFQEWIANKAGYFITLNAEATVRFESAIPNWKDGKIRLNKLYVHCIPRSELEKFLKGAYERDPKVTQGDLLAGIPIEQDENRAQLARMPWFNLTIDTVEIELSLIRLMEGKGIVKSCSIKGVRGFVDNRRAGWNSHVPFDPEAIRKKHIPGDFEVNGLTLEDMSVTVYMPSGFRPFPVSILQAQLSRFRRQWMFYDLLCADTMIGSVDSSLFSVHTPQLERSVLEYSDLELKGSHPDLSNYYPFQKINPEGVLVGGENKEFGILTDDGMKVHGYKRQSRLRITGLSMDHIHRFGEGPPQWITSGTVDFCADIYIPDEGRPSAISLGQGVLEILKQSLPKSIIIGTGGGHVLIGESPHEKTVDSKNKEEKFIIDIDVRFKDIKATVPLKIPDLSHLNSAMVRPVIAYINHNRTIVPIKGRIVMDLDLFNGAWTIYHSTLDRKINASITKGFVDLVKDQQERNRRLKQIGVWSFREMVRNVVVWHEMLNGSARGFWSYLGQ
ncbi:mitochondrial distribution and morphology protein family 31/32 [Backusella circina FSU 941]|nr:mitochondrial distribution and morphology protein family 31/32 [Backusella circina FSU 941]